jgi:hypothetical protein
MIRSTLRIVHESQSAAESLIRYSSLINEFGHDAKEILEYILRKFEACENGTVVIRVICSVANTI